MKHQTLTEALNEILSMDSGAMIKVRMKHLWVETYQFQPLTKIVIELYAESPHLDYVVVKYMGRTEVYSNDKYLK